jgi:acyl transferase domain-containing protein
LKKLVQDGPPVLLEVGAGNTFSAVAAQALPRDAHGGTFQSLPDHTRDRGDAEAMAQALGGLWTAGVPVDWSLSGPRGQHKISLPGPGFSANGTGLIRLPRAPTPYPKPQFPNRSSLRRPSFLHLL